MSHNMDCDAVLREIGEFGRWQQVLQALLTVTCSAWLQGCVLALLVPPLLAGMHNLLFVFTGAECGLQREPLLMTISLYLLFTAWKGCGPGRGGGAWCRAARPPTGRPASRTSAPAYSQPSRTAARTTAASTSPSDWKTAPAPGTSSVSSTNITGHGQYKLK